MPMFAERGHPVFRGTSLFVERIAESEGTGKLRCTSMLSPKQIVELSLRTIISINQLGVYGAVAHWCNNQNLPAAESHVEQEAESEVTTEFVSRLTKHKTLDTSAWGDLVQKRDEEFENLPAGIKLAKICEDAGFTRTVSAGQLFVTRSAVELIGVGVASSCREFTHLRDEAASYPKRAIGIEPKLVLLRVL